MVDVRFEKVEEVPIELITDIPLKDIVCPICNETKKEYDGDPRMCIDCYTKTRRVYMIGKIEKSGWRHKIVPSLRERDYWCNGFVMDNNLFYMGPFFIGCDHGCYHGNDTHGAGAGLPQEGCINEKTPTKKQVFDRCLKQIFYSDYIFCWIDSMDAYGSFIELGAAIQLKRESRRFKKERGADMQANKKIFLAIDKVLEPKEVPICSCGNDFSDKPDEVGKGCCHSGSTINSDDLWFSKEGCDHCGYYSNAKEAWADFLNYINPISEEEKKEFKKSLSELTHLEKKDYEEMLKREPMSKVIKFYNRNQNIVTKLKKLYNGKCQVKDCNFTFKKEDGDNYCETHHLKYLENGGDDDIKNMVCTCPNHHKILHYGCKEEKEGLVFEYKKKHYDLIK